MGLGLANPRLRHDLARTVGRRIDSADIEDVVQATLAEALSARALPQAEEEIRRFVFAIARQKVADWYRRRGREARRTFPDLEPEEPLAPSADLLRWANGELPATADAHQTFDWMLREGQGETLAEIANAEGLSPMLVRQRVSRLRRFLRARWSKELAALGLLTVVAVAFVLARSGKTPTIVADEADGPIAIQLEPPSPMVPHADLESPPTTVGSSHAPGPTPRTPAASPIAPREGAPQTLSSALEAASGRKPATLAEQAPFDRSASAAVLGGVSVKSCATASTAAGSSHITVTFQPDGSVVSAKVDAGTHVGTPEAACVEGLFSKARIPAFQGANVRVGKAFTLP